jgi:PIN domain nuclease of toxin-antitoxin system
VEALIRLDTHVVVWLYTGESERFSAKAAERLAQEDLVISPIVDLELAYLFEVGRLRVPGTSIVSDLKERLGLQHSAQSLASAVAAAIPLNWTRDPFDRLIVGDALGANSRLLTKDSSILANCTLAEW